MIDNDRPVRMRRSPILISAAAVILLACEREPAASRATCPSAPVSTSSASAVATSSPRRPPAAAIDAAATTAATTAIVCPTGGGDALGLSLRYEGRSTVTATACRSFELAKVGLKEVSGDPHEDHFELRAADGRLLFTGIWSNPFVPMEGPLDDQGRMGWTTGEVRPPQTWELIVPNRPDGKILELWAVAHAGATPVLKARVTLR